MEQRLRILLYNAIDLLYQATGENYNNAKIWFEDMCNELGTDANELTDLGLDVNEFIM